VPLPDATQVEVILLDIEGTTTPLEFVYDVLFPYAVRKLEGFLRRHIHDPEVRSSLAALKEQRRMDSESGLKPPPWLDDSHEAEIISLNMYVQWSMARDTKYPALKFLQGKIWEEGYGRGELRGQVYPDVPRALERWRRQGKRLYIYSSGSVLAQKLLFLNTGYGDLTRMLDGFFDTRIGTKADEESYRKIAAQIRCETHQVLFISDAPRELKAAQSTGMHTALSVRTGQADLPRTEDVVIQSFDEVFP
jgi:enolase-phosphatase E1